MASSSNGSESAVQTPLDRLQGETPLDRTRTVRDISVTERGSFRDCRRQWYLETIENLVKKGAVQWPLEFGTGMHSALEAFYRTFADLEDGDPLDNALAAFEVWYQEQDLLLVKMGDFAAPLRDELLEFRSLGMDMLRLYNEYSVDKDKYIEPLWIEGIACPAVSKYNPDGLSPPYARGSRPIRHESGRIMVPIVHPRTKRRISSQKGGTPPYLSARLDMIMYRKDMGYRGFWIMDHKTSASAPSDRGVDFEDQITGYCYVFWRLTGIIPRGTIFNYLVKQVPKPPRLVYEGKKLSTAKDQLALASDYEAAMYRMGETSEKHKECLASLKAFGWSRFFTRFEVERNEHELMRFEERLIEEYHDMLDAYKRPATRAYPNMSTFHCPNCSVNSICQAIEDGSDYELIIDARYTQGKDRKAK